MSLAPRPTAERVWGTYLVCVVAIAWTTSGGGSPGHDPVLHTLVHGAVGLVVLLSAWIATRRAHAEARVLRAALAVVGLPVVFSAMCYLLPGVHPEPYEYLWLEVDRALFGDDIVRLVEHALPPWFVELLQLDYAAYYVLCIGSALLAGWGSGGAAFDRAVLALVVGFLASYLGYLLVPTLAPKVVLADAQHVDGLWATPHVRRFIDEAEANHWDCFPSGHTMLTIVALIITFRWHRRGFWWLLLPGVLLVSSTMLLRYHWSSDVIAGAVLAWPAVWLSDRLADRDGWPAAGPDTTRRRAVQASLK